MRSNNTVLTASLLLSLAAGCSLIKVNGKPLGGGSSTTGDSSSSSSTAASSESAGSTSSAEPARKINGNEDSPYAKCRDASARDYEPCMQRVAADERKQRELAMSKQPAWCKDYHLHASGDVDLDKFKDITDAKRDMYSDAVGFAVVMCSVEGRNLEQRPKVMELRTAWMKHHGLDEKDFLAAVSVQTRYVPDDQKLTALGPAVAQMELVTPLKLDQHGAKTSMLGRIAYVERCMDPASAAAIRKILCAREPLDLGKALAEIDAAPSILPHMRLRLRLRARKVVAEQRQLNAELAALAKEEPAVTKLIAIADAQHKEWTNPTPARAKAVKLLEDMEAATIANKSSAFAGCEATTGAAWADAVRAATLPAVSTEHTIGPLAPAVFTTVEAFLARRAYELCMDGTDHPGATPYGVIASSAYRRGPRTGTVAAWLAASGEIAFDSKSLTMADVVRGQSHGDQARDDVAYPGTIASITPKGKGSVEIAFKTDIGVREDCINWKRTGRISNITAGGAVEYENICMKRGMVKYDKTPDNITVDAVLAAGLKPGMYLLMTRNSMRLAEYPIVATANAKSSKAVWLFGVSLK
ncbi:MAG: hypothetical protein JNL83_36180 [Myxococcales bacterium]|nr:hypothetical protein [Myxococcales bacterium]